MRICTSPHGCGMLTSLGCQDQGECPFALEDSEHRADAPKGCPVQAGCSTRSEAERCNPRRTDGQDGPFNAPRSGALNTVLSRSGN